MYDGQQESFYFQGEPPGQFGLMADLGRPPVSCLLNPTYPGQPDPDPDPDLHQNPEPKPNPEHNPTQPRRDSGPEPDPTLTLSHSLPYVPTLSSFAETMPCRSSPRFHLLC